MPELNEREQGYADAIIAFGDETFILRYKGQQSNENGRGISHTYRISSADAIDLEARTVRLTRHHTGVEEIIPLSDITWIAPAGCRR